MDSVFLLLALAGTAGGSSTVAVPLLVLAQIASLADASALASGAVAAADPRRRGAALAVFAFVGYSAAFIGPVAVGIALDAFGGTGSASGWSAAFVTMALGSAAAALAMRITPERRSLRLTAPVSDNRIDLVHPGLRGPRRRGMLTWIQQTDWSVRKLPCLGKTNGRAASPED